MKILITGNSQAAGLKSGYDKKPKILDDIADIYFYVAVGGAGPAFDIENDILTINNSVITPDYPPWMHPKDMVLGKIHEYDVIVVSALGYIDGAFYFNAPITRQGVIYDFKPKLNNISNALISKNCYKKIIFSCFYKQPGVQYLISLSKSYNGLIILQPFPLISDAVIENEQWPLNLMYENPLDAHRFFCEARDDFFRQLCEKYSIYLLSYPNSNWLKNHFTPKELMSPSDGVHAGAEYGIMIMKQIAGYLSASQQKYKK